MHSSILSIFNQDIKKIIEIEIKEIISIIKGEIKTGIISNKIFKIKEIQAKRMIIKTMTIISRL